MKEKEGGKGKKENWLFLMLESIKHHGHFAVWVKAPQSASEGTLHWHGTLVTLLKEAVPSAHLSTHSLFIHFFF